MKLRLQTDSLRLRLTPAEVAALGRGEAVTSATRIAPGAALAVAVGVGDVGLPGAAWDGGTLAVTLPARDARVWAGDDREGLYADQDAGDGHTLAVAVEKDYDCDHREPSGPDTFPRPDA